MIDFFTAIESEQQNMFNPQTNRCVCVRDSTYAMSSDALSSVRLPPTSSNMLSTIRSPNSRCR